MNWTQLQAILWLRWRLTKNQWARAGQLNAVLTLLAMVAGLLVALAGCVGGVIVGATLLEAPAPIHLIVWDIVILAFLFYWAIGVVTELQRSESIDLTRLLHLPVSLKEVFFLNYLASHLALSLIIFLPGMLGLILGLIWGTGWRMLGLAPLVLGFLFTVTAWTYCLRGWLVSLMVNQRRRRTIVMVITLAVILGTQLPNLYFNVYLRRSGHRSPSQRHHAPVAVRDGNFLNSPAMRAAHRYVPPLWVAKGAMELSNRNPWPALWATAGFWVLGALGLARAYRATLRFYRGEQGSKGNKHAPAAATTAAVARPTRPLLIEREFPGIPEPAQTLALASFRSLTRAPEVKLVLTTNFIFLIVFALLFISGKPSISEEFKPFVVTLAIMVPFFALTQLLFNQFGVDRDAFRAFILLPAGRRDILLGKNLAYLPLALGAGGLILGILLITLSISPLVLLAGVLQLLAAFMLFCMLGNLASILVPYRVAPGSLKPTKTPLKSMLLISLAHLMFPVAMIPVFLPPGLAWLAAHWGWLPAIAVNLPLSLAITGGIACMYWASLDGLGYLLSQREQAILAVLAKEVE